METPLFGEADKPHILVVDDDDRIRQLLSRYLRENGFVVSTARDANTAEEILKHTIFDGLVVDVMMPGRTGTEFTRDLRESTDIPIVLLTALGEVEDRVKGFEAGADDYLPKPFEPKELLLRLQAILRRRDKVHRHIRKFRLGKWCYNPELNEMVCGEEVIRLTNVETKLLESLSRHPGKILSREELARLCAVDGNDRTIDVQVTRLRRKIEDDSRVPRYLQTIRGQGYLLHIDDDTEMD